MQSSLLFEFESSARTVYKGIIMFYRRVTTLGFMYLGKTNELQDASEYTGARAQAGNEYGNIDRNRG